MDFWIVTVDEQRFVAWTYEEAETLAWQWAFDPASPHHVTVDRQSLDKLAL